MSTHWQASKALLGNRHRLSIAAAIADSEEVFYARGIAARLGVPENIVGAELKRFALAGILVPLPRLSGQLMQEYQRVESAYWSGAQELLAEIEARASGPSRRGPVSPSAARIRPRPQHP